MHGKLNGKTLQPVPKKARQSPKATLAQLALNEGFGSLFQMVLGKHMLQLALLNVYQASGVTRRVGSDEPCV